VEETELLEALLELAREAQLEVRVAGADADPPVTSGACRVRGAVWVVLARADPLERQIDALARALRDHAGDFLEQRYLPPALRARLGEG
jgi:hypothetical protein